MPSNTSEYQHNYYLANKQKILNQIKVNSDTQIMCECCNKMIKKGTMFAHKTTKKHRYAMNKI